MANPTNRNFMNLLFLRIKFPSGKTYRAKINANSTIEHTLNRCRRTHDDIPDGSLLDFTHWEIFHFKHGVDDQFKPMILPKHNAVPFVGDFKLDWKLKWDDYEFHKDTVVTL